jgi:hypothetical protein
MLAWTQSANVAVKASVLATLVLLFSVQQDAGDAGVASKKRNSPRQNRTACILWIQEPALPDLTYVALRMRSLQPEP